MKMKTTKIICITALISSILSNQILFYCKGFNRYHNIMGCIEEKCDCDFAHEINPLGNEYWPKI